MWNTLSLILVLVCGIVIGQAMRPISLLYLVLVFLPAATLWQARKKEENKVFFALNIMLYVIFAAVATLMVLTFGRLNLIPFL